MPIKSHTNHYYEDDEDNSFPIPFEPDEDSILLHIQGDRAVLACLASDEAPNDPLTEWDEGEFYQFNSHYSHYQSRPDVEDFKRTVRDNPGRVVLIYANSYSGYFADDKALDVHHTKSDAILEIEDADGYYIAPDDVNDPATYAKGIMGTYSAWAEGDVWGVCVWLYNKVDGEWELDESGRDECWGYYGRKYAEAELKDQFKYFVGDLK